eukprot:scaffold37110_cov211-Skeletonema_dohrnii-CCMP3373.AAC.1
MNVECVMKMRDGSFTTLTSEIVSEREREHNFGYVSWVANPNRLASQDSWNCRTFWCLKD